MHTTPGGITGQTLGQVQTILNGGKGVLIDIHSKAALKQKEATVTCLEPGSVLREILLLHLGLRRLVMLRNGLDPDNLDQPFVIDSSGKYVKSNAKLLACMHIYIYIPHSIY